MLACLSVHSSCCRGRGWKLLLACVRRPFDTAKMSAQAGGWSWVGVPQSILLNNQGFYGDCTLLDGTNTAVPPKCNVTLQWVAPGRSSVLPYAGADNPGAA